MSKTSIAQYASRSYFVAHQAQNAIAIGIDSQAAYYLSFQHLKTGVAYNNAISRSYSFASFHNDKLHRNKPNILTGFFGYLKKQIKISVHRSKK